MGKKGGAIRYNKETKIPKIQSRPAKFTEEDMDDEIDAFHKQRDIIPLDLDDDMGSSDEDNVQSVYDIPGSDDDDDEEDEYVDDKFTRKMAKQQQYMRQKTGGVKDETHDDVEEEEEETLRWGLRNPYGGDNADMDGLDSDNEDAVEEENEALRIRKESLRSYSPDNFGLGDDDLVENSSDAENLEDVPKTKSRSKHQPGKEAEDDSDIDCEVKKDINALSKEEQMEVVYSSAPEVVGLLSELKDALNQLDKVNPLISMVKKRNDNSKEGIHYLETKKLLLLAYCQAISFYLLLKSEGRSVRDHPVLARLVELKSLLDKMKQIDDKLPSDLEEILDQDNGLESESESDSGSELIKETVTLASETVSNDVMQSPVSVITNEKALVTRQNGFLKDNGSKEVKRKRQVSSKSMEMLKIRESLEQKLKQKGVFSSVTGTSRSQKFAALPANRQLETIYDYGDEVIDNEGSKVNMANGHVTKLPKLISTKPKNKVISGDDDLPLRDDIGERRRKYEQRVLANAGVDSNDENEGSRKGKNVKSMDVDDEEEKDETDEDGEDEFYKKVKRQRLAKLSQKEEIYSRKPSMPYLADTDIAEGKRGINRQIEKNRGLTRYRKKQNPRTEYKKSYEKRLRNRGGQVPNIKKPTGTYGGETSGINKGISRSRRFN